MPKTPKFGHFLKIVQKSRVIPQNLWNISGNSIYSLKITEMPYISRKCKKRSLFIPYFQRKPTFAISSTACIYIILYITIQHTIQILFIFCKVYMPWLNPNKYIVKHFLYTECYQILYIYISITLTKTRKLNWKKKAKCHMTLERSALVSAWLVLIISYDVA